MDVVSVAVALVEVVAGLVDLVAVFLAGDVDDEVRVASEVLTVILRVLGMLLIGCRVRGRSVRECWLEWRQRLTLVVFRTRLDRKVNRNYYKLCEKSQQLE